MVRRKQAVPESSEPFLRAIRTIPGALVPGEFPFNVPSLSGGVDLELTKKVSFFVGENGSGKSTLLEAVAVACGFSLQGGTRDHRGSSGGEDSKSCCGTSLVVAAEDHRRLLHARGELLRLRELHRRGR